jgi:uncharacterized phage infection (PIP) family protein YhgE
MEYQKYLNMIQEYKKHAQNIYDEISSWTEYNENLLIQYSGELRYYHSTIQLYKSGIKQITDPNLHILLTQALLDYEEIYRKTTLLIERLSFLSD